MRNRSSRTTDPEAEARPAKRRPGLTRGQVLTAAMTIVDERGIDELTMRRLGQAPDRHPMAIYRHAMDKDLLLDGLVDRVISFIVQTEADQGNDLWWAGALRETAHRFRRAALAHPNIVPTLVTRQAGVHWATVQTQDHRRCIQCFIRHHSRHKEYG